MVRRTRGFIRDVYAETDPEGPAGSFYASEDETRSYFRIGFPGPSVSLSTSAARPMLTRSSTAQPMIPILVNALTLPRYGLGNYIAPAPDAPPTPSEARIMQDLSRAGPPPRWAFAAPTCSGVSKAADILPAPSTKPQGMTSAGSKSSHPPSRYTWTKKATASPRNFISARATPPVRYDIREIIEYSRHRWPSR